jgi:hypothetical protein
MKKTKMLFILLAVALFMSCEWSTSNKNVDYKLHGTWESTVTNPYSGKLVIDFDTITITGYDQFSWTIVNGRSRNLPKVPLLPVIQRTKNCLFRSSEMFGVSLIFIPQVTKANSSGSNLVAEKKP